MSDAEFTLYAYTFRSRAERVLWVLKELNLSYKIIRLDPYKGETLTPDFLQLNPQCKIPVLVHNQNSYTESLAIMEYLNDVASGALVPKDPQIHYQFRHLMYFMLSELEAYLWVSDQATRLKGIYQWPEGVSDEALARVKKAIPHLFSEVVKSAFAVGDYFSLADIYAYQIIQWAVFNGVVMPDDVALYIKRLEQRSAFPAEMIQV